MTIQVAGEYDVNFLRGFEGQLATDNASRVSDTYTNPDADMFFGRAVVQGVLDDEVLIPSTSGQVLVGVTHHTHAVEVGQLPDATTEGIPATKPANILRQGQILVTVEEAVTPADAVFFRHASPGALPEAFGRFRTDADVADATAVPNARFRTSAAAGELAVLVINLPG